VPPGLRVSVRRSRTYRHSRSGTRSSARGVGRFVADSSVVRPWTSVAGRHTQVARIYVAIDGLGAIDRMRAGRCLRVGVRPRRDGGLPVVHELQSDVEFLAPEQALDLLQFVFLLRRHPELIALDLGPDPSGALIPYDLRDLLRVVLRDALLKAGEEAILLARRLRLPGVENLERDAAPDQLLLEYVEYGVRPLLAVRPDLDCLVAGPGDRSTHAAEVEPCAHLLSRLIQRIVDFLVIDLRHDVERGFRCHGIKVRRPGADAPGRFRYPSTCCPWRTAYGRLPEWPKGAVC